MRLLMELDMKNYAPDAPMVVRPSVRGIVIRRGRVAMVYNGKYGYYTFPGGGIETGETPEAALMREMAEETGLTLLRESIRPYGRVHSVQKGMLGDTFVQDNDYYLCSAEESIAPTRLEAYETEAGYTLVFVSPEEAMTQNLRAVAGGDDPIGEALVRRDNHVLKQLVEEGYFT